MIKLASLSILCGLTLICSLARGQEAGEASGDDLDLLHFLNGDYLHGTFAGIGDSQKVTWQHPEVSEPIEIETGKLRRIALKHGKKPPNFVPSSYIQLENGDRIPGEILTMDQESVRIGTSFTDELSIPRQEISRIAPSPYGGKLFYYGPFSPEKWTILNNEEKSPTPEVPPLQVEPANEKEEDSKELKEDEWVFSGAAWYNSDDTPISLAADLPDEALISFNLAWKNRLSAIVAFHANLKKPEPELGDEEDEKKANNRVRRNNFGSKQQYPQLFGQSYVLTLYQSHAQLQRCSFDEDGNPAVITLDSASFNIRLAETGDSTFELRCDRKKSQIALYVEGQFVTQWTDRDGYAGTGTHLAFASTAPNTRLRISEVIVSSWNGMVDSAQSMQSPDRDIILLTNGTDRFSGQVKSIENKNLLIDGTFAEMSIPLADIQEIRFAEEHTALQPASPSEKAVRLLLYPLGRITVEPRHSTQDTIECQFLGSEDLSIALKLVDVIEFSFGNSALDAWSEEF